jgi:hypothetical protein
MTESTSTEKTTKTEGAPAEKAGKTKKANARDMLRESGKVKKAKPAKEAKKAPELCVFAFRLTKEQRDTIHTAAGPAKASQFVLNAALAAAAKKAQ